MLTRFAEHQGIMVVWDFFLAHGTGYWIISYLEGGWCTSNTAIRWPIGKLRPKPSRPGAVSGRNRAASRTRPLGGG